MSLVIPSLFIIIITAAVAKKVNVFSSFCAGAEEGLKFTLSLLPILAAVFMMCQLLEVSGIADALARALSPVMNALGVPEELAKLALIKPFSGSGSLSLLTEVLEQYGADSYPARCACTIYASSETVYSFTSAKKSINETVVSGHSRSPSANCRTYVPMP